MRANITPDQEFKDDIGSLHKKASRLSSEQRWNSTNDKITKLQQAKSRTEKIVTRNWQPSSKADSAARKSNVNSDENVSQLAEGLKTKISEVDKLLVKLRTQAKKKESEWYPCLLSAPLKVREMSETNTNNNWQRG